MAQLPADIFFKISSYLTNKELGNIVPNIRPWFTPNAPLVREMLNFARTSENQLPIISWNVFNFNLIQTEIAQFIQKFSWKYPKAIFAGGFFTSLLLDQIPSSNSDIDIFLEKNSSGDIFFGSTEFGLIFVNFIGTDVSNWKLHLPDGNHVLVQFILTKCRNVAEVVNTFDNNYNRCGFQGGVSFASVDCLYAKRTRRALFYKRTRVCRAKKAIFRYKFTCDFLDFFPTIGAKCCSEKNSKEYMGEERHKFICSTATKYECIKYFQGKFVENILYKNIRFSREVEIRINVVTNIPKANNFTAVDGVVYTNDPRIGEIKKCLDKFKTLIRAEWTPKRGYEIYNYTTRISFYSRKDGTINYRISVIHLYQHVEQATVSLHFMVSNGVIYANPKVLIEY